MTPTRPDPVPARSSALSALGSPRLVLAASGLGLATACVAPPTLVGRDAPPSPDRAEPPTFHLSVYDAAGRPWSALDAPRSPTLVIEANVPLAPSADAFLLLRGEADEPLRRDLAHAPLNSSTEARRILAEVEAREGRLQLRPKTPLAPGELFTVAVAPWAVAGRAARPAAAFFARLEVSSSPEAGAAVFASVPADGTSEVPTNLAAILVAFDGRIQAEAAALEVRSDSGAIAGTASVGDCGEMGAPGVSCIRFMASAPWPAGESVSFATSSVLRDATGAAVPTFRGSFRIGGGPDRVPPGLLAERECPLDGESTPAGCAVATDVTWSLETVVDEPARLELRGPDGFVRRLAPRGDARLQLHGLMPGVRAPAILRIEDLAGLVTHVALEIATHDDLPTVTVSEVCADPEGPEPAQEWVELHNFGTMPVELRGMSLSDREESLGTTFTTTRTLAPGSRIVVASDAFDPDRAGVPPGASVLRVGRTLVSGGLANSGEPVYLRDARARRLALVPAMPSRAGACVVRREDAGPRADSRGDFHYAPCSPGFR